MNELRKRDKMRGLPSILSLFRNGFNKFNETRARIEDSIYHMKLNMTLKNLKKSLFSVKKVQTLPSFTQRYSGRH